VTLHIASRPLVGHLDCDSIRHDALTFTEKYMYLYLEWDLNNRS